MNKFDLMECMESITLPEDVPNEDVKIVDGAALEHILDLKKSQVTVKTFQDYSQLVFLIYMGRMLHYIVRIDVVWDVYREDSLKAQTRQNGVAGNQLTGKTRMVCSGFYPIVYRSSSLHMESTSSPRMTRMLFISYV